MKPRIFISAVSSELRSARQLVANVLQYLGYEPVWQEILPTNQGDMSDVLRNQIDSCHAVIQVVGFTYGAEPPAENSTYGRVSYTQFEALYAQDRGKPLWTIVCKDDFPFDTRPEEEPEKVELQDQYRKTITSSSNLFHPIQNLDGLESVLLKLRDDLKKLRRSVFAWAAAISALLVAVCTATLWQIGVFQELLQEQANETDAQTQETRAQMAETASQEKETQIAGQQQELMSENVAMTKMKNATESMNLNDYGLAQAIERLLELGRSYSNAQLRAVRLDEADMSGHNFSGTNFERSSLRRANLRNANLSGTKLGFANVANANLAGSRLNGAMAWFVTGPNVDLSEATSHSVSFFACDLRDANLSGSDLSGSTFAFCDLREANFTGADLSHVNFFGAVARDANFSGAKIDNTHVGGTQIVDQLSRSQVNDLCRMRRPWSGQSIYQVALDFWVEGRSGDLEDLLKRWGNVVPMKPSGYNHSSNRPLCEKPDVALPPCCMMYEEDYQEITMREKVGHEFKWDFLSADDNREAIVNRVETQMKFLKRMDFQKPELEILRPADNARLSEVFTVQLSATDNMEVDFFEVCVSDSCRKKGSPALRDVYFEVDPARYDNGEHTIVATAVDHGGNKAEDRINVVLK